MRGTEWIVDAEGCSPGALRDLDGLRELFERILRELDLKQVGETLWHRFPGPGGITGLALLRESHLACHTYPEHGLLSMNLYCCAERPAWPWEERLAEALGATRVSVRALNRLEPVRPRRAAAAGGSGE